MRITYFLNLLCSYFFLRIKSPVVPVFLIIAKTFFIRKSKCVEFNKGTKIKHAA